MSEEQEIIAKRDIDYMNNELNAFLGSLEPTVPVKVKDYLYDLFLFTDKNIIDNNTYLKN